MGSRVSLQPRLQKSYGFYDILFMRNIAWIFAIVIDITLGYRMYKNMSIAVFATNKHIALQHLKSYLCILLRLCLWL